MRSLQRLFHQLFPKLIWFYSSSASLGSRSLFCHARQTLTFITRADRPNNVVPPSRQAQSLPKSKLGPLHTQKRGLSTSSSSSPAPTFWRRALSRFFPMAFDKSLIIEKQQSPSAERNKTPIWNVLGRKVLPLIDDSTKDGSRPIQILEVAAGAGVHTAYLSEKFYSKLTGIPTATTTTTATTDVTPSQANTESPVPSMEELPPSPFQWQSTDPDASAVISQSRHVEELAEFVQACVVTPRPLTLVETGIQEVETDQAIQSMGVHLIININMIHISPWDATKGLMKMAAQKLRPGGILYLYGPYRVNGTTAPSNLKFEQWLKAKDIGFGVRNLEDVLALATEQGLELAEKVEMPANNLSVIIRKPAQ